MAKARVAAGGGTDPARTVLSMALVQLVTVPDDALLGWGHRMQLKT
jgi:hypothetical protein